MTELVSRYRIGQAEVAYQLPRPSLTALHLSVPQEVQPATVPANVRMQIDKCATQNRILSSGRKGIAPSLAKIRGPCKISKCSAPTYSHLIGESGGISCRESHCSDLKPCYSRSSTGRKRRAQLGNSPMLQVSESTTAAVSDETANQQQLMLQAVNYQQPATKKRWPKLQQKQKSRTLKKPDVAVRRNPIK
ncbi:unnamed protein product [Trichogramma brassicae]|uniref:Uncharacterized protein n=1 Tax=Trichogramma brassicae TaxID=86971 RepID=A0A6H5I6Z4_9HYME|nr:unnamed protein product [Trichogramma brassicae]